MSYVHDHESPFNLLVKKVVVLLTTLLALTISSLMAQSPEEGLVAHWTFDEFGDGVVPAAFGSHELVIPDTMGKPDAISGDDLPEFTPELVEGKIGKSLSFTAEQQGWLSLPNVDSIGLENEVTLSFWIKVPDPNQAMVVLSTMDGPRDPSQPDQSAGWIVYIRNWQVRLDAVDSAGKVLRASTHAGSVVVDEWHHVAVVFAADEVSIYVDGDNLVTESFLGGATVASRASLVVGNYNVIGRFRHATCPAFSGQIDDLRIYSRALGEDEVRQLTKLQ